MNGKVRKKALCLALMVLQLFLPGCWSAHEVNELAISVAIGIDRAEEGYMVTEQIINPKAVAAKKVTSQEDPVIVSSAEGPNLESAIKKLYGQSPRMFFNAHLRVVVVSEEIAEDGITDFIDFFYRSHEYRSDFYFVIAKGCSAQKMLSTLTPLESVPAVGISDLLKMAAREWAPVKVVKMTELVNEIVREGINPVLPELEIIPYKEAVENASQQDEKLGIFRFSGLGILKKDRLVGRFDSDESKGYNYIMGDITHTNGSAGEAPLIITYDIINIHSHIEAKLENGSPSVLVNIGMEYRIEAMRGNLDVTKVENREKISGMAASRIEELCRMTISKAQNEYRTDVFGFGEKFHQSYPEYWKTAKDNWDEIFASLPVTVKVKAHFKTSGEITNVIK